MSDALAGYLARHSGDDVTEALNAVAEVELNDAFLTTGVGRTLESNAW